MSAPGSELSHLGLAPPRDRDLERVGPCHRWILERGLRLGWGVRVRRPFGARGRSSVRYGTRLGDLKENCFLLFSD